MEIGWVWMRVALTLLVACYVLVYKLLRSINNWYYDLKHKNKDYPLPPGDMGWPLIGNFLSFIRDFSFSGVPDSFLNNIVSKYGRNGMYKTHLFGRPAIIVSTPELCRKVLADSEHFKLGYPKSVLTLVKSRQFIDVEQHKRFRRQTLAPIIGQSAVSVYMRCIEDVVTASLEGMAQTKGPLELFQEAMKVSFSVILHVILGSSENNYSMFKELEDLFHVTHKGLFSLAIDLPGFTFHKALQARRKSDEIIKHLLEARREKIKSGQQETKKDLIDIILDVEDEISGRKLEDEDIIDLLMGLLFGGQMTTAGSLVWSIIYLLDNPHVMEKAKEEQEEIMKARPPSQKQLHINEIKQMVYLDKVINETFRMCNLAFAVFREATDDVNINGYFIPKGWRVITWMRAVHMNPEYYPNPKEFNPSRWDDYNNAKVFLPFGSGSRLCPGRDLAKLEITIFLHYFLLGYKFERMNPNCAVTYLPASMPTDNCLVKVFKA